MAIEHGTFSLTLLPNNIVVVDAKGPWNIEAIDHYHNDVAAIVSRFAGNPWHHIAILRCETVFIPQVVARLEQHFLWRKKIMYSQTPPYLPIALTKTSLSNK